MTHATFDFQKNHRLELTIDGHATGSDVVCAGISSLANALQVWLQYHPETSPKVFAEEEGHRKFIFTCTKDADTIIGFLQIGLGLIAKAYPDYIKITTKHWRRDLS